MKNHDVGKLNIPATLNKQHSDSVVSCHLDLLASNSSFSRMISHVASKSAICSLVVS